MSCKVEEFQEKLEAIISKPLQVDLKTMKQLVSKSQSMFKDYIEVVELSKIDPAKLPLKKEIQEHPNQGKLSFGDSSDSGSVTRQKEYYTEVDVLNNPNTIYVFGDNDKKSGKKGQAVIRDAKNAFGIATKVKPSTVDGSYYDDENYNQITKRIEGQFKYLQQEVNKGKDVVFPGSGLGTGLARLEEKAPKVYKYLQNRTEEFINSNSTTSNKAGSVLSKLSKKLDQTKKSYPNLVDSEITQTYERDIELGKIEVNSVEDLIKFNEKFNSSVDGTETYLGKSIGKSTEWYNGILDGMSKSGFKFQPLVIQVVPEILDEDGYAAGVAGRAFDKNAGDSHARIILPTDGKSTIMPIAVVVHEYVHTITTEALRSDIAAKNRIRTIMDKAEKALGDKVKNPNISYAFTNEFEFVAEVIANPYLQNELNKIASTKNVVEQVRKLFTKIMERFKGNKNTLLTETLNEIYQLQLPDDKASVKQQQDIITDMSLDTLPQYLEEDCNNAKGCK
jgi:hypothetical protein